MRESCLYFLVIVSKQKRITGRLLIWQIVTYPCFSYYTKIGQISWTTVKQCIIVRVLLLSVIFIRSFEGIILLSHVLASTITSFAHLEAHCVFGVENQIFVCLGKGNLNTFEMPLIFCWPAISSPNDNVKLLIFVIK